MYEEVIVSILVTMPRETVDQVRQRISIESEGCVFFKVGSGRL